MKTLGKAAMLVGIAAILLQATGAPAAPLPQKHPYQKALRDYLASLTEKDFTVDLKPVKYVRGYFSDLDTVARYWMLFLSRSADIPSSEGIRVPAKHFTLAAIEAGDAVNMGPSGFVDPKYIAWWAQWDYPGNPYYKSTPVKLRAFVAAAVDMMMMQQDHDNKRNRTSISLGGGMIRFAYAYWAAKDAVPASARKAYEAGLIRMFEKLEKWTPHGSGGSDMEFFQLVGMWYAADALGGQYKARALKRAHVVIDRVTSKTGYEKHGAAFDASYQGIALRFLTWAAMLYDDPKVNEALHKMLVLKSHLSLPEPDGAMFGPTHFSTGTAADAPHDQWAWVSRDAAMSMIDDEALYTVWARIGIPDEAAMRAKVKNGIERLGGDKPSQKAPAPWRENHWSRTNNYAFDLYRAGFYKRLVELDKRRSPLSKPPFGRSENFIRDLNGGGEFLAAKFADYGAIIHTGAIATRWASGVSGKSGGSLSAFWTPECGTVILGRCRATQSKKSDEWTDANKRGPYTWGVHAITGIGANGNYFTTARIRSIKSAYKVNGTTSAVVRVSGDLAGSKWADPQDELKGSAVYAREFRLDTDGVAITSGINSTGNKIRELWEMIPARIDSRGKAPATKIGFRVKGKWVPATETPAEADQVRLNRYGKDVYITFDKPRPMKMSPDIGKGAYGGVTVRNIMVDLRAENAKPLVRYKITTKP